VGDFKRKSSLLCGRYFGKRGQPESGLFVLDFSIAMEHSTEDNTFMMALAGSAVRPSFAEKLAVVFSASE
jgi:hypothetical protein